MSSAGADPILIAMIVAERRLESPGDRDLAGASAAGVAAG
jgi:hypothetical protein